MNNSIISDIDEDIVIYDNIDSEFTTQERYEQNILNNSSKDYEIQYILDIDDPIDSKILPRIIRTTPNHNINTIESILQLPIIKIVLSNNNQRAIITENSKLYYISHILLYGYCNDSTITIDFPINLDDIKSIIISYGNSNLFNDECYNNQYTNKYAQYFITNTIIKYKKQIFNELFNMVDVTINNNFIDELQDHYDKYLIRLLFINLYGYYKANMTIEPTIFKTIKIIEPITIQINERQMELINQVQNISKINICNNNLLNRRSINIIITLNLFNLIFNYNIDDLKRFKYQLNINKFNRLNNIQINIQQSKLIDILLILKTNVSSDFYNKNIIDNNIKSIAELKSILTNKLFNHINRTYINDQQLWIDYLKNKCEHKQLLVQFNLRHVQIEKKNIYNKLVKLIDFKNIEDHTYKCKLCGYRLICEHIVCFFTEDSTKHLEHKMREFIDISLNDSPNQLFCKYCGQFIMNVDNMELQNQSMSKFNEFNDIERIIWSESKSLFNSNDIVFIVPININSFILQTINAISPIINQIISIQSTLQMTNYIKIYTLIGILVYILKIEIMKPGSISFLSLNNITSMSTGLQQIGNYVINSKNVLVKQTLGLNNMKIKTTIIRIYQLIEQQLENPKLKVANVMELILVELSNSATFNYINKMYNIINNIKSNPVNVLKLCKHIEAILKINFDKVTLKSNIDLYGKIEPIKLINKNNNFNIQSYNLFIDKILNNLNMNVSNQYYDEKQMKEIDQSILINIKLNILKPIYYSNYINHTKRYKEYIDNLYRKYDINGNKYIWDIYCYKYQNKVLNLTKDQLKMPEYLHLTNPFNQGSSSHNPILLKTQLNKDTNTKTKYNLNRKIHKESFYKLYIKQCPLGLFHEFNDKNVCVKCLLNEMDENLYYDKYKKYIINLDIINEVKQSNNIINKNIKQKFEIIIDNNKYDNEIEIYNNALIKLVQSNKNINTNELMFLGLSDCSIYYNDIINGTVNDIIDNIWYEYRKYILLGHLSIVISMIDNNNYQLTFNKIYYNKIEVETDLEYQITFIINFICYIILNVNDKILQKKILNKIIDIGRSMSKPITISRENTHKYDIEDNMDDSEEYRNNELDDILYDNDNSAIELDGSNDNISYN